MLSTEISIINNAIGRIVECFYQQRVEEGYRLLEPIYTSMENIIGVLSELNNSNQIDINIEQLMESIGLMMNALERKDPVLLADVLKYELQVQLTSVECNRGE